ncbi:MAG: BLUF domain-containing protein [Cyclobacteriaceae bacterium]
MAQSRNANKKTDITGILLYILGKFIQALECEKSSVNKRYTKIAGDFIIKRVRL